MGGPEMIPPITRHASRWQYMIHAAPSGGRWKAVAVAVGFVSIAGHAPLLLKESREGPRGPFQYVVVYFPHFLPILVNSRHSTSPHKKQRSVPIPSIRGGKCQGI